VFAGGSKTLPNEGRVQKTIPTKKSKQISARLNIGGDILPKGLDYPRTNQQSSPPLIGQLSPLNRVLFPSKLKFPN
jgi:hypothetical protein